MGELVDVVRRRRMTRAFDSRPVDPEALTQMVDLASRAPSAGKAQGWHLVVLQGAETAQFWDITLPVMRRGAFKWQRLLDAPLIALPFADPKAYTDRYSEPDKAATGLGAKPEAWPAPYWTIDASMAVMTMLLAAEDLGLGALFFGVFKGERQLRQTLGVPPGLELLGALAIGHPADPTGPVPAPDRSKGRSADRPRRSAVEIIHPGHW
ncbi:MAG: nitroreductase family protein [Ilumatobacter sp.]|nr:MAG: nitroreductase family protein [Ilumatobacter sp.]